VWTGVIPLEDWKITFKFSTLAHRVLNFRKNVVAEETQERELGLVPSPFVGAGHIAVSKIGVALI
jgi:hypothetical protein